MNNSYSLRQLGWQPYFQQQLSLEEFEQTTPARVIAHHRSEYWLQSESSKTVLFITPNLPSLTVGDWILLDDDNKYVRELERQTYFSRKAAGHHVKEQAIAANVDTLFIVMSLNQDFNLSRLERYLTLASDSGSEPVVILTKADLCEFVNDKVAQVQKLDPLLSVVSINALNTSEAECLKPWCKPGKTVSFVGSSGVGKSTLINCILGDEIAATSSIREDDDKGKHTTTSRALYVSEEYGVIIDTPGMREIQIHGSESSLQSTFTDIEQLAKQCRFSNCSHINEPGCEVLNAVERGELELRRLQNFQKLQREMAHNNASLKELRDKDKQFGKMVRNVIKSKQHRRDVN